MKRLVVFFSGSVQGVGFRYTVLTISKNHRVAGWVRNRSDGRVELQAEGDEAELEAFLEEIRGEMASYISNMVRTWETASGAWQRFEIQPTQ
jgi:acylphosphatase